MNNKLLKTDTFWYKVKYFLKSRLIKKQYNDNCKVNEKLKKNKYSELLKDSLVQRSEIGILANQMLVGELGCSELNASQVDEMTEYFKNDIKKLDNELIKIKRHIIQMKEQL